MDLDSDGEIIGLPLLYPSSASAVRRSPFGHEKRKAEGVFATPALPPLKRQKGDFNAAYLSLLNEDIQDASLGLVKSREEKGWGEVDGYEDDDDSESSPTQIGAVVWSVAEKNAFFAAVSRLGRDNVARIAARIGTKSELEVQLYLAFLDAARRQHPVAGEGKAEAGAGVGAAPAPVPVPPLAPVDVPAAVEIGAECAASLEAAADALALRQEGYEEEVEKERWGARWKITGPIARILDSALHRQQGRERAEGSETATAQQRDSERWKQRSRSKKGGVDDEGDKEEGEEDWGKNLGEMPCIEFFHVENWVSLSDRVFMNSTIADGNWRSMSEEDEPPAIRTTALADFHALALSVTKRLLLAAAYVAESRARKNTLDEPQRRLRPRLRPEDVKAAVSSLGMRQDSKEFWARCARRLQLDIVDDGSEDEDDSVDYNQEAETEDIDERMDGMDIDEQMSTVESSDNNVEDLGQEVQESEEEEDDDYEIMSYDEVEAALGIQTSAIKDIKDTMSSAAGSPETNDDDEAFPSPEDESSASSFEDPGPRDSEDEEIQEIKEEAEDDNGGLNREAIERDIEEAMTSIAYTEGPRALPALRSRIRTEHRLERDAERLDLKASAEAEARLWTVLRGDGDAKRK